MKRKDPLRSLPLINYESAGSESERVALFNFLKHPVVAQQLPLIESLIHLSGRSSAKPLNETSEETPP